MKNLFNPNDMGILQVDTKVFAEKYKQLKKLENEVEEMYAPLKDYLISSIEKKLTEDPSTDKSVVIEGIKFTYISPSIRNTVDTKKLKEEEPELAKKYNSQTMVKSTLKTSIEY